MMDGGAQMKEENLKKPETYTGIIQILELPMKAAFLRYLAVTAATPMVVTSPMAVTASTVLGTTPTYGRLNNILLTVRGSGF